MRNNFCRLREPELKKLDPNVPVDLMGMLWSPFHMNEQNGYILVPVESFQHITDFLTDHAEALAAQKVAAVGLPKRDESLGTAECDFYANGYRHGWNAYHDAVEPLVAGLRADNAKLREELKTQSDRGDVWREIAMQEAKEHDALRSEVERLRDRYTESEKSALHWMAERDALRAEVTMLRAALSAHPHMGGGDDRQDPQ